MYNIQADPDLGVGCAAFRHIPCACHACMAQLSLPWQAGLSPNSQPQYKQNKSCEKWDMFEGTNDWEVIIITIDPKKKWRKHN